MMRVPSVRRFLAGDGLPPRRLLLAACVALGFPHPASAQEGAGASFVEEFETLSPERWYVSDGWTNGDHQNCGWSKDEIGVKDGRLFVGFSKNPAAGRQYRCGEIQTTASFGYGTYEARIRTPRKASGLNANVFTYIGPVHGKPHDEIDFEFLLKDTNRVQLNVIKDGKGGNEHLTPLFPPSDAEFSDYAFVWEPGAVSWYVNGVLAHRIDDPAKLPTNDGKIFLSLWGTDTLTEWMGPFADPGQPLAMEVERVAFTAAGAPCQFPTSLVCAKNPAP